MSDPRYRPSDFVASGRFGISTRPVWVSVDEADPVMRRQLGASRMQHLWARAISARVQRRDLSEAEYAVAAGTTLDRLQRMLRGQVVMRIEDMASAEALLGVGPVWDA